MYLVHAVVDLQKPVIVEKDKMINNDNKQSPEVGKMREQKSTNEDEGQEVRWGTFS